ncbi:Uncharacterised protein [Bordetella pertussis]|nr:Uncharacterised protein [Bordetella pertussis]
MCTASVLAPTPGRAPSHPRQHARQVGGQQQLARVGLSAGEVEEHHLRIDVRETARQLFGLGQFLHQQAQVADGMAQLLRHVVIAGTEEKAGALVQSRPFASVCLHVRHCEKPGICWPLIGPSR